MKEASGGESPHGVHGIEARRAILDYHPADIVELIQSAFDAKPPLVIDFEEHDRGKKISLRAMGNSA
jgi:hypothetical protein